PTFWHERWVGELGLVGQPWGETVDDLRVPQVWNNIYPNPYGDGYQLQRTPAQILICKNDVSGFMCDQGCPVSYMGLGKYGWWHRHSSGIGSGVFMRKQMHEVDNPVTALLLAETEPFHYSYGGCGCRLHVYRHPKYILKRHFGGGNILFFDGHITLVKGDDSKDIDGTEVPNNDIRYWEPDYESVNLGNW
ncbi:hypothetical protein HQ576_05980, partial [bacterium]|nr:hypothetical protein [bacterium]